MRFTQGCLPDVVVIGDFNEIGLEVIIGRLLHDLAS